MPLRFDQVIENNVPDDFRVELGATDITPLVALLEIERPLPDVRIAQLWSGRINLIQSINVSAGRINGIQNTALESFELDPQLNNSWKAYGEQLKIFADGRYICVLRLTEDLKYDYLAGTATAQIGHYITAFNSQKPKQLTGFEVGSSFNAFGGDPTEILGILPARRFAEKLLDQSLDADGNSPTFSLSTTGLDDFLQNTFNFGGSAQVNGYSTDPRVQSRDLAATIHEILWINYGRALTNDTGDTENLRFSDEYPCFQGTGVPTLVVPTQQLDITIEPAAILPAATVAEGSGSLLFALQVNRDEFPKVWTSVSGVNPSGDDDVAEETEMNEPNINGGTTTTSFTKRSPEWFLVNSSTATTIITLSEDHTEVSDSQGRPISYEIEADLTRSQLSRMDRAANGRELATNRDPDSTVIVPNAYFERTTWTYDSEGHKESVVLELSYPEQYVLQQGSGDARTVFYRRTTRYERVDNSNVNPEWWETTSEAIIKGGIEGTTDTSLTGKPGSIARSNKVNGVPEPEYKRRAKPLTFQSLLGEGRISAFGSENGARRIDISSDLATSGERLEATAELMACINAQLRPETLDIQLAMPDETDDLEPFRIWHIGTGRLVGRTAISCVRCGPRIVYRNSGSNRSTVDFSFTAYRLGDLTDPIEIIKPPVLPSTYLLPLQIASLQDRDGDQCLKVGVTIIPIELNAFEGTPPYVFSAPGGLPPGLSIVGSQIVGSPTTVAASATFTIRVDDSLAAFDTTTFDIEICDVPIPDPHYSVIRRGVTRRPTRTASVVIDDTCVVVTTGGDTVTTTGGDTVTSGACTTTTVCDVVLGGDSIIVGTDNVVLDCEVPATLNVLVGTDNVVVGTDNVVSNP